MRNINLEIMTDRLLIRQYSSKDAEHVHHVINNEKISEVMPSIPYPYPRETVDWWINFVNNNIKEKTAFELGIFLNNNQQYIGNCELRISKKDRELGFIGYFIDPKLWNNGYASEAVNEILKFGFEVLSLHKIIGRCIYNNKTSERVLIKSGFEFANKENEYIKNWDKSVDILYFQIEKKRYKEINQAINNS